MYGCTCFTPHSLFTFSQSGLTSNKFLRRTKYTYFFVTLTQYPVIVIPFITQTPRFYLLNPCSLTCCLPFWWLDISFNSLIRSCIASKRRALHFLTTRSAAFEIFATLSNFFPVKCLRILWFNSDGIDMPPDTKTVSEFAFASSWLSSGLTSSTSKKLVDNLSTAA